MKFSKSSFLSLGSAIVLVGLFSCAGSAVRPVEIPDSANVSEELTLLGKDIVESESRQANVLSPGNFNRAKDAFMEAKSQSEKGADGREDALKSLGWARGYLRAANETTTVASREIMEVSAAREAALKARGPVYQSKQMKNADGDLAKWGKDFEDGGAKISMGDRKELQDKYLDIELQSIKMANLGDSKHRIELAKKNKAAKVSPQTLAEAEKTYASAEAIILTDRHATDRIATATAEANTASERLLRIMGMASQSRKMSPEEIALATEQKEKTLAAKDQTISDKNQTITDKERTIEATEDRLSQTATTLNQTRGANRQLSDKVARDAAFEQTLENARKTFSASEAEVYRQGDLLLIRLKGLNFTSGKSDIPAKNLPLLTKVKDVIESLGAEKVVVEGHTDSVGGKSKNMALSQNRAETVANYLVSESVVQSNQVSAVGFGYEKPLATNKNIAGRAQNRRVDIIVTPEGTDLRGTNE